MGPKCCSLIDILTRIFPKLTINIISPPSSGGICSKIGQRMEKHYIFPNYHLDQPNPMSVAGGTAGSVEFDGPSMPSEICSSSCSSTTCPIHLVLVFSSSPNTTLRCLHKCVDIILGSSQNGRRRPQNGNTAGFSLELGHFRLC